MSEGVEEPDALPRQRRNSKVQICLFLGALAIAAFLAFPGLDRHAFWHDEAHTALLGRNLMKFGKRTAWDGRNLVGYRQGSELNENLEFIYAPPQELYLAALGMKIFGDTRFGARVLFVAAGVLGIAALGWWARRFFAEDFPWWLPPMLLSLCPAYLLYIRNCRYYAPALLWVIILWAAWSATGAREISRNRFRALAAAMIVATLGLCTSQYVYAMAAAGILPLFLLDGRFRTKRHIVLLLGVGGLLGCYMLGVYFFANPLEHFRSEGADPFSSLFKKITVITWWQIRDLGFFEFFAWPMILPLLLPWLSPKFAALRNAARLGAILVAFLFGVIVITAVFTPQAVLEVEGADLRADIRHSLPVIPIGVMISGAGLFILWRANRYTAFVVGAILVGSSLLFPGATGDQPRHRPGKSRVRSTLADYWMETTRPYESVYDTLARIVKGLPEGTTVRFFPDYMPYSPMFEAPHLLFSDQLSPEHPVRPDLAAQLPKHVYSNVLPDRCIVYGALEPADQPGGPKRLSMQELPHDLPRFFSEFGYEVASSVPTVWPVGARPEISRRWFSRPEPADDNAASFVVYRRKSGE